MFVNKKLLSFPLVVLTLVFSSGDIGLQFIDAHNQIIEIKPIQQQPTCECAIRGKTNPRQVKDGLYAFAGDNENHTALSNCDHKLSFEA